MDDIGVLTMVELALLVEALATVAAAIFAFVGIAMVYIQIRENRAVQREATAKSLFRQYLQEAFERPELVHPDHDQLRQQGRSVQYELFVANMLWSFDEVLQNMRSDDWCEVVHGEVARHAEYIRSAEFQSKRRYYASDISEIIDTICADVEPKPPVTNNP